MPTFDEPEQPAPGQPAPEQPALEQPASEPPAPQPGAAATPPAVPPPLLPTPSVSVGSPTFGATADPSGVIPPPAVPPVEPKKKSPVGRVAAFLVVAAAAIGAILVKFVLPLVLVGAVGQVFDSAFGGPYGRLPGDVRSGFEKRLDTAFGSSLDGQTDTQKTTRVLTAVKSGLSRLDDSLVAQNFQLTTKAIGAVDVPSCAAVSRAIVAGTEPPEAAANAMINTLSDAELQQWFEIRISAIEADLRGSPAQVAVADDQVNPLYEKLFTVMSPEDIDVIGNLAGGETVDDAALCTAVRDLYSSVQGLSAEEALLFARYDVSP